MLSKCQIIASSTWSLEFYQSYPPVRSDLNLRKLFHAICNKFQTVKESLAEAQASVGRATNEKEKAEALIAVECMEALNNAV